MILVLATGPLAPVLQAVGWALLHLVWQGAAIAAALALLLALLPSRSAGVRYVLASAALALVVVVGVLTAMRSYTSIVPAAATARTPPVAPAHARPVALVHDHAPVAAPSAAEIVVATFAPGRVASLPDPWRAANDALPAVVSLWLAGVTLLSLRLIVQWLRARRLATENAQPACEPWLAMARRLSRALGVRHAVRLLESTAVQVPAVIGLLRPVILLPANTLTGLMPGQLEMILAHELAHIRRHDFLVNLLQAAVETLLFYHPAVWWISRQVRIERENCCDDLAIAVCGSPLQYARALTRLEELRAETLPLALSANGGTLLGRIRRVVSDPSATTGSVRGVTALALLVCLLLAFAAPSLSAIARPGPVAKAPASPSSSFTATAARTATAAATTPAHATATRHAAQARPKTSASAACADAAAAEAAAKASADAGDAAKDASGAAVDETGAALDAAAKGLATAAASADAAQAAGDGASGGDAPDASATDAIAPGRIRLTIDELIQLRSLNVSTSDLLEVRTLFPHVTIAEVTSMFAVGATPDYVRQLRAAGIDVKCPRDAQSLAAVGVTPKYVADIRAAGLEVESASVAAGLAAVGVTPEFVREMRSAGLKVESASQAQSLAAVGVTADFVREMRSAGLKVESASEAQSLAAVGVTADYVRDMRASGLPVESASQVQSLAAVGVTPEYVREMRATGLSIESASQAQSLAAVGVTPDYVREMRAAGVPVKDAKDAQSLSAMGVTPKFVRKLAKVGYSNLAVSDLCRLAAGGVTDDFIQEMRQYRTR